MAISLSSESRISRNYSAFYDLLVPLHANAVLDIAVTGDGLACHLTHRSSTNGSQAGPCNVVPDSIPALPFASASIDCVLVDTVCDTGELAMQRAGFLDEAHRVLVPGGSLLLHVRNSLDLRAAIRSLRHPAARRGSSRHATFRASYRTWRDLVRVAGFGDAEFYVLPELTNGSYALVSMSPDAAAIHYRYNMPHPVSRISTDKTRLLWLLVWIDIMRFLEPSFIIFLRK